MARRHNTRNEKFLSSAFFFPLTPHLFPVVVVVARFSRCSIELCRASPRLVTRNGSVSYIRQISGTFADNHTGRRMKKHLSASGKEVRPASWHLFLRISRRIYYEITRRCGSARWISIRPPTDSYFFFPPFLLCFLSFCARVDEFERFTGWNSSQALNEGSLQ